MKTQQISSDNNPLIDNCSESTLRNQMFSDLYALRNRGVCVGPDTETQQKFKKGTPQTAIKEIYTTSRYWM